LSRHSYLAAFAFAGCGLAAHAQTPPVQTVPTRQPPAAAPERPAEEAEAPAVRPDVILRADKLTEDRDRKSVV